MKLRNWLVITTMLIQKIVIGFYKDNKKIKSNSSFEEKLISDNFSNEISREVILKFQNDKLQNSFWYQISFEFHGDNYSGFHWIGDCDKNNISVAARIQTQFYFYKGGNYA